MSALKQAIPAPIRALRWRARWMRTTPAYRNAPLTSWRRALGFTLTELLSDEFVFTTPEGHPFATMRNNFSSFAMHVAGSRDPEIWRFIEARLGAGAVFVDAGANVGAYTVPAARLAGGTGRVIACEAHPRTFGFLARNVAANGLGNVIARQVALGEAEGEITFAFNPDNPGETHVAQGGERGPSVPMTTLDALLAGLGVRTVDYLKVDVEGFELPVLRGAQATIAASPTIVVQTELVARHAARYGSSIAEIAALLGGHGLAPHSVDAEGRPVRLDSEPAGDVLWFRRAP